MREVGVWKKDDKVMLSINNFVFKEKLARKLTEKYIKLYIVEEVVFVNAVKLRLPISIRIHLVINISQIIRYKEPVERQKMKKVKPIKIKDIKE